MKKFAAPIQAFLALLLCSGMGWMVFVLGSVNPAPPTAMDLKARNTQDLSFSNMNSTAVALAKEMLAYMVPSPSSRIFLPVTGRESATPGPAAAMTLRAVYTPSNTPTPLTPLKFLIPATSTREKNNKPPSTATSVPAPTKTLQPPTATIILTQTPLPPTQVVNTPTEPPPAPTATSVPPTAVPPTLTDEPTTEPPQPTQPPAATAPIVELTEPPSPSAP
jgi:hypothetical protein